MAKLGASYYKAADMILAGIKAPINRTTRNILAAQIAGEKPANQPFQHNNPLNTTRNDGSTYDWGSQGNIAGFPTPEAGVKANVLTLLQPNFKGMLTALRNSNANAFGRALGSEPWGTSASSWGSIYRGLGGSLPAISAGGGGGGGQVANAAPNPAADLSDIQGGQTSAGLSPIQKLAAVRGLHNPMTRLSSLSALLGAQNAPQTGPASNTRGSGGTGGGDFGGNSDFGGVIGGLAPILPGQPSYGSYGYSDPEGQGGHHLAVDWFGKGKFASPVSGKVARVTLDSHPGQVASGQIFGGTIAVRDQSGRLFVMRHTTPRNLAVGTPVTAGETLGTVKKWTGQSHVHLEAYKPGSPARDYNPADVLNVANLYKRYYGSK